MRIEHIIDSDTKARLGVLGNRRTKSHPKPKNDSKSNQKPLSEREIKELMGCNRQTYKRVNGKVKRK